MENERKHRNILIILIVLFLARIGLTIICTNKYKKTQKIFIKEVKYVL